MSHWYDRKGNAQHTYLDLEGEEKPTGIKQARKNQLLPSVSGVIKTWNNTGLAIGRERALLAEAFTHRGEAEKARFTTKTLKGAFREWDVASAAGTTIHACLEDCLAGKTFNKTVQLPGLLSVQSRELVVPAMKATSELEMLESELILVNLAAGYAGTMDFAYKRKETPLLAGVGDFKTCKTKKGEKIRPKQGQAMQIAAYWVAYWGGENGTIGDNAEGRNVYISTTEPGRVETVTYNAEELKRQWEAFQACLTLWRLENNYDPRSAK